MRRRERWDILGLILGILQQESAGGQPPTLSRVAQRANVPYDRFVQYLEELRSGNLITPGDQPALTEKGEALLRSWRQWETVLQRFGLD
jgi:predicted transcriptional regulator